MTDALTSDPVLARLRDWAREENFNKVQIADQIGVSRAAVTGWFLALEDIENGKPLRKSGRMFRFVDQPLGVQNKIATVLGASLLDLRMASLASRGLDAEAERGAGSTRAVGGQMAPGQDTAGRFLGELVAGEMRRPESLPHRVAEVVDAVEGVAGTLVLKILRGADSREAYEYNVVVLAHPADAPAAADEDVDEASEEDAPADSIDELDQQDVEELKLLAAEPVAETGAVVTARDGWARLSERIDRSLSEQGLPGHWEHTGRTPELQIRAGRRGPQLHQLGSLVVHNVEASRPPVRGLLVRPGPSANQLQLRHAAVVTPAYGGSSPIAGLLAATLGAGHLRADEIALGGDRGTRPNPDLRPLPDPRTTRDWGFQVHQALFQLQLGKVPGAWLVSMEADLPQLFDPLRIALTEMEGPLIVVRLGEHWQRMAAWRLAAAKLSQYSWVNRLPKPWSSDDIDMSASSPPTPADLDVLRRQARFAERWQTRLREQDSVLARLVEERSAATARPVYTAQLSELPDDRGSVRFSQDGYRLVTGPERFGADVAFLDALSLFVDEWVTVALGFLDELAALGGHQNVDAIRDALQPARLGRALAARADSLADSASQR